jgi:putative ATPase
MAEYVGQEHLLGPGRWLRRALDEKNLTSLILWGPPGTGKTTLGRLLAAETQASFVALSAVMSGVKEVREAVAEAAQRRDMRGGRTLLFIDEIHRFNKAQQDALLPHVEAGTVILVGATTENPSFEVNAPLLSRAKVVVLKALSDESLRIIIDRALADPNRGLGLEPIDCPEEIRNQLANEARGDARRVLSALESAAATAEVGPDGRKQITEKTLEEALQRKTLVYDKSGDEHYMVVSAFIKRPSKRRFSERHSSTTSPATSTTWWSAPSSRACAAVTPTLPCTGWRACWRPARTPCSSFDGW